MKFCAKVLLHKMQNLVLSQFWSAKFFLNHEEVPLLCHGIMYETHPQMDCIHEINDTLKNTFQPPNIIYYCMQSTPL